MIRAVLIAFLAGLLIGGGTTATFAYIVTQAENERLAGIEADLHRVTHDFDMGVRMIGDLNVEPEEHPAASRAEGRRR